jgi:hypothetical protein
MRLSRFGKTVPRFSGNNLRQSKKTKQAKHGVSPASLPKDVQYSTATMHRIVAEAALCGKLHGSDALLSHGMVKFLAVP